MKSEGIAASDDLLYQRLLPVYQALSNSQKDIAYREFAKYWDNYRTKSFSAGYALRMGLMAVGHVDTTMEDAEEEYNNIIQADEIYRNLVEESL